MRINCPHCHNGIEVVPEKPIESLTCPSCGSNFNLLDVDTATYRGTAPKKIGRFELIELLGSGHFGDVWLAKDTELDRFVAIKLPRKEELESAEIELFLREARSAAQLKHPNIVSVHEVGKDGDLVYIVSDLVRGPNLADWLTENHFSPQQAAELCATLADAIHHAHESGVIHRDLKPGNVLLDENKVPHLTDFGLAKRDGGEITVTVDGRILGTPAYMSPEQARGDAHNADRRSDVYSLGVILYELLTGTRPFSSKSRMLMIHQVLHEEPRLPRKIKKSVPRDLETICLKAMSKEPPRRYQTAREMAEDLRRHLAGKPILARPVSRLERTWRWARRNPLIAIPTAVAAVALIAFGAVLPIAMAPPKDTTFRRTVKITTEPEGATVVFIPLGENDGQPRPEQSSPPAPSPATFRLIPGYYLVVAYLPDGRFHEVYRFVPGANPPLSGAHRHNKWKGDAADPTSGGVELRSIEIPDVTVADEMVFIQEIADFVMGDAKLTVAPPHHVHVPAFYLEKTEVTVSEYLRKLETLPPQLRDKPPPDDFPITFVSWDDAVAYAEAIGKRLMDEAEYEVAATAGGAHTFPWGDDADLIIDWKVDSVGSPKYDIVGFGGKVIHGLYSNAAEWTSSWHALYPDSPFLASSERARDERVVRGAPDSIAVGEQRPDEWKIGPRARWGLNRPHWSAGLSFRCARSPKPRLVANDFVLIVKR